MKLIAVYGSLLKGMGNSRLLTGSELAFTGEIPGFDMYSLTGFPGIVPGDGTIKVEVYSVDDKTLLNLDRLEGHPNHYERTPVVCNGIDVEIYVYKYPVTKLKKVESGDWRSYYNQQGRTYAKI